MKYFVKGIGVLCLGLAWSLGGLRAAEETVESIEIVRTLLGEPPVPVSIEGLSGELLDVVRFDLEAQGFKVVASSEAQYQISGTGGGSLKAAAVDRLSKATLLSREYTGGNARLQAHTFTDEFLETIHRQGIARRRIVFRVEAGQGSEIYLADYDGFNATAITRDGSYARDPSWIPGRRALFYTSYKSGSPMVYSHDLSSGVRKVVAGYGGLNGSPAASPVGDKVAMILSKSGSPDLFIANADGTGLRQLTSSREDESSPCWSPDGRQICVASRQSGKPRLYLVPSGGGSMRALDTGGSSTEPSWSPDGRFIAYTISTRAGFQICVMPASGGRVQTLTEGEDPVWAANSRTLLFTRRVGDRRVLSLLDVPTKQVKDVRRFSGSCSQPDWCR